MEFSSADKIIISHLLESGKCDVYLFHENYLLSPAQIARAIRNFTELGLISFHDGHILLTKNANSKIFKLRHQIYFRSKPWRMVPKSFRRPPHSEEDDYFPKYNQVDKRLIKILQRDEESIG